MNVLNEALLPSVKMYQPALVNTVQLTIALSAVVIFMTRAVEGIFQYFASTFMTGLASTWIKF